MIFVYLIGCIVVFMFITILIKRANGYVSIINILTIMLISIFSWIPIVVLILYCIKDSDWMDKKLF